MKKIILSLIVLSSIQSAFAQGLQLESKNENPKSVWTCDAKNAQPFVKYSDTVPSPRIQEGTEIGAYNDTTAGVKKFWGDDIIGYLCQSAGEEMARCEKQLKGLAAKLLRKS